MAAPYYSYAHNGFINKFAAPDELLSTGNFPKRLEPYAAELLNQAAYRVTSVVVFIENTSPAGRSSSWSHSKRPSASFAIASYPKPNVLRLASGYMSRGTSAPRQCTRTWAPYSSVRQQAKSLNSLNVQRPDTISLQKNLFLLDLLV